MIVFYKILSWLSLPFLFLLLKIRSQRGKEDVSRVRERMGKTDLMRPGGPLLWLHAASVGEAQSALILLDAIAQERADLNILVTTGTVTSAALMDKRLPEHAVHQYYPLDHPNWCSSFLDHWAPDWILWMESELWPNMLNGIKERSIPAVLVNARLSDRSFKRWSLFKGSARSILNAFELILTQTDDDKRRFESLGHTRVETCGNLKFSAAPLPCDESDLKALKDAIGNRPCWVYASTHEGEEDLACSVHSQLQDSYPDLLTIIVPRHPERGEAIAKEIHLPKLRRTDSKALPERGTAIYIADTLGELGLFYRVAPIAMVGRTFSNDGGGGHNPIEAAQLNCAVLSGPHIQYQKELFYLMENDDAVLLLQDKADLEITLADLLQDGQKLADLQARALNFANTHAGIVHSAMVQIAKVFDIGYSKDHAA